jgi:hypothetical protein
MVAPIPREYTNDVLKKKPELFGYYLRQMTSLKRLGLFERHPKVMDNDAIFQLTNV